MNTTFEPAITNITPWNTEDLLKFLLPLCGGTTVTSIQVELQRTHPGTKRADQKLFEFAGINCIGATDPNGGDPRPDKLTLYLLSPKRAAARVDALGRMALVHDLEAHEALLPESVVLGIAHAFTKIKKLSKGRRDTSEQSWDYRKHLCGKCECKFLPGQKWSATIRGNTKTRTALPVDISRLERQYDSALHAAEKWGKKRDEALERAARLKKRISREAMKLVKANNR